MDGEASSIKNEKNRKVKKKKKKKKITISERRNK